MKHQMGQVARGQPTPRTKRLRAFFSALLVFGLATFIAGLVAALPAQAAPNVTSGSNGNGGGPGNNGTLKVHEYGTPSGTESNDPKVCVFNFEGFSFDAGQTGYLMLTVQGGDGPTGADAGPFNWGPTDSNGYYATGYFNDSDGPTIQNGHYKATLYGKWENGAGVDEKAKSKVFKVDCESTPTSPPTSPTTAPTTAPTTQPTSPPTSPTSPPTSQPTSPPTSPTTAPTTAPTTQPTSPTTGPTTQPTSPTTSPTLGPPTSTHKPPHSGSPSHPATSQTPTIPAVNTGSNGPTTPTPSPHVPTWALLAMVLGLLAIAGAGGGFAAISYRGEHR